MRKLYLTGLATEQPFFPKSGNPAAEAKYFLVFNEGELRVQVTERDAEACVSKMMEDETDGTPLQTIEYEKNHSEQDEPPQGIVMGRVDSTYSAKDEDGVDQV